MSSSRKFSHSTASSGLKMPGEINWASLELGEEWIAQDNNNKQQTISGNSDVFDSFKSKQGNDATARRISLPKQRPSFSPPAWKKLGDHPDIFNKPMDSKQDQHATERTNSSSSSPSSLSIDYDDGMSRPTTPRRQQYVLAASQQEGQNSIPPYSKSPIRLFDNNDTYTRNTLDALLEKGVGEAKAASSIQQPLPRPPRDNHNTDLLNGRKLQGMLAQRFNALVPQSQDEQSSADVTSVSEQSSTTGESNDEREEQQQHQQQQQLNRPTLIRIPSDQSISLIPVRRAPTAPKKRSMSRLKLIRPEEAAAWMPRELAGDMTYDNNKQQWVSRTSRESPADIINIDDVSSEDELDSHHSLLQDYGPSRSPSAKADLQERSNASLREHSRQEVSDQGDDMQSENGEHASLHEKASKPDINSDKRSVTNANATPVSEAAADVTAASQIDASFSETDRNLVRILTDANSTLSWDTVEDIDLHSSNLDTIHGLDQFCPCLIKIDISHNRLRYLQGLPPSTREVFASFNKMGDLCDFSFLENIEYLDISNNEFRHGISLEPLIHLRELVIDNNKLESLDDLFDHSGILKLSIRGNKLTRVDFTSAKWHRLEELDLSFNSIKTITGLENLTSLAVLKLEKNCLKTLDFSTLPPSLRVLQLSDNKLSKVDVSGARKLVCLILDKNCLRRVDGIEKLRKLHTLSIRSQSIGDKQIEFPHVQDVKILRVSGNKMAGIGVQGDKVFTSLAVLEAACCSLESLTSQENGIPISKSMPNLRHLDVGYNMIKGISALKGMMELRSVLMAGNRISSMTGLAENLDYCPRLRCLDLRGNPVNERLYPPLPLLLKAPDDGGTCGNLCDVYISTMKCETERAEAALRTRRKNGSSEPVGPLIKTVWTQADEQFQASLASDQLSKRINYRQVLTTSIRRLRWLDGWLVT